MLFRSIPLIACLLWLGYEAGFSPSFFAATIEASLNSISQGIDGAISGDLPSSSATKMASANKN